MVDEIIENQPEESDLLRSINKPLYQQTWSPSSNHRNIDFRSRDSTVAGLEKIYRHMSQANSNLLNLPYSTSRTVTKGISPPRYRSIIQDQIFPGNSGFAYRRASMPYLSSLGMPSTSTHAFGGFKTNQLEKITEMTANPIPESKQESEINVTSAAPTAASSNDGKGKKTGRKFIVTPIADP